ncbi:ferredoxin--NADP reductase [Antrihabitans sp. YC2-6]|uniref:ferredoxin--NADP reductase n=1 Tax=Antrihabitans sp. YC2-6 TaxID=2799498 RepID=UPI0018F39B02|nr:ferredoxin--NADP reductase [Antrihabitans sp. YC2-6]MBJ8344696.1 ferredoxin--NADP reductase [Antrihabitans sp. YC2-6]
MAGRAHEVRVLDVVEETADAVTLVLDIPHEVADRFTYACGQFLTVRVPSTTSGSVARCYSLCSSPDRDGPPAITIKRTPAGFASNWLCDNVVAGDALTVLEPAGTFGPRSLDRDVLLCAAGSGVTPILSITKSVLAAGSANVAVLYANRDRESVIFAAEFDELVRAYPGRLTVRHWLETERGLPTEAGVAELVGQWAFDDVYLCGPAGFMTVVQSALKDLGVSDKRVHREEYRSLVDNPFETAQVTQPTRSSSSSGHPLLEVEIDGRRLTLEWPKDRTLLDVLLAHGIDAPYVCRESACGTCVCSVRKGRTRMLLNESLIDDEIEMGLTLACQSLPETEEVYIAFDQ